MDNRIRSALGLTLAIAAVSTAAVFIRLAQSNLPSIVIAAYRLILSSIFLFPVFIIKNLSEVIMKINRRIIILILISGFFLALHFLSWITSLEFTNITSSVVLVTTTPIWVSIISIVFLKEKVNPTFWLGLFISVAGTIVITASQLPGNSVRVHLNAALNQSNIVKGNILALVGAWCAAGYVVLGKIARKSLTTGSYVFLVYSVAATLLGGLLIMRGQPFLQISPRDWMWLILLALVPQTIGHSLLNWALGVMPASHVSISLLGEPVGASLLAFVVLKETPAMGELLGVFIILAGIYLALKSEFLGVRSTSRD